MSETDSWHLFLATPAMQVASEYSGSYSACASGITIKRATGVLDIPVTYDSNNQRVPLPAN